MSANGVNENALLISVLYRFFQGWCSNTSKVFSSNNSMEGIRVEYIGSIPKDGGGIEIIDDYDDDDGYDTYDYKDAPKMKKFNIVKEIHVLPERQEITKIKGERILFSVRFPKKVTFFGCKLINIALLGVKC